MGTMNSPPLQVSLARQKWSKLNGCRMLRRFHDPMFRQKNKVVTLIVSEPTLLYVGAAHLELLSPNQKRLTPFIHPTDTGLNCEKEH